MVRDRLGAASTARARGPRSQRLHRSARPAGTRVVGPAIERHREVERVDSELISKKELLTAAGISYGQLYRWKRKGLIPEDWFVRKSTFTGQETFFPRDKVLQRVEKIKTMKDEDVSLDDIADAVSPNLGEVSMTIAVARKAAPSARASFDTPRLALSLFGEKQPERDLPRSAPAISPSWVRLRI